MNGSIHYQQHAASITDSVWLWWKHDHVPNLYEQPMELKCDDWLWVKKILVNFYCSEWFQVTSVFWFSKNSIPHSARSNNVLVVRRILPVQVDWSEETDMIQLIEEIFADPLFPSVNTNVIVLPYLWRNCADCTLGFPLISLRFTSVLDVSLSYINCESCGKSFSCIHVRTRHS